MRELYNKGGWTEWWKEFGRLLSSFWTRFRFMTVILKHLNSATFPKDFPIYHCSEPQLALSRALRVTRVSYCHMRGGRCGTADLPAGEVAHGQSALCRGDRSLCASFRLKKIPCNCCWFQGWHRLPRTLCMVRLQIQFSECYWFLKKHMLIFDVESVW